ncbi:hypothetical protein EDD22DRAFT_978105 [Suillus occidentalis]|nr:hypothetical protein EDD22DRAFT_978105 [Suillus occidentalis]
MSSVRPLFVVAGIGNGTGTGAATARLFAKSGYRVALISRGPEYLDKLATELNQAGGEAATFPLKDYTPASIKSAFTSLKSLWPSSPLRVAVFNAGYGRLFAFARAALLEFTKLEFETANEGGVAGDARKRGTLIFTGATASIRGNTLTSAFSASKFGIRALSQSLAKEFDKQNIHRTTQSIIDGISPNKEQPFSLIRTKSQHSDDPSWEANQDVLLDPNSIAKSYLHLVKQDSSAWTWEIDLRPAHEKW